MCLSLVVNSKMNFSEYEEYIKKILDMLNIETLFFDLTKSNIFIGNNIMMLNLIVDEEELVKSRNYYLEYFNIDVSIEIKIELYNKTYKEGTKQFFKIINSIINDSEDEFILIDCNDKVLVQRKNNKIYRTDFSYRNLFDFSLLNHEIELVDSEIIYSSALIIKKCENVDIDDVWSNLKEALRMCGYGYSHINIRGINVNKNKEYCGNFLMFLFGYDEDSVFEQDCIERKFKSFCEESLEYNKMQLNYKAILEIRCFFENEDMLFKVITEYMKLDPETLFWLDWKSWYYTSNDIENLNSKEYSNNWCYENQLRKQ